MLVNDFHDHDPFDDSQFIYAFKKYSSLCLLHDRATLEPKGSRKTIISVLARAVRYRMTMAQSFVINTFGSLITRTLALPSFLPLALTPGVQSHFNIMSLPSTFTLVGL